MVNALIKLNDETNKVLNIVKAQNGLKDKGEAVELVVSEFMKETKMSTMKKSIRIKSKQLLGLLPPGTQKSILSSDDRTAADFARKTRKAGWKRTKYSTQA
ncbi:hypothetical protein CMO91_04755 [Candidatus Woesearchaeota archaeon]|nr:hypothetical protein [Candidatus Woesearchaeota archaeon]|tara:strand:- start:405 stop:707 length:303 start_codon:yes stop_codon:yes gene_type:complete